MASSMTAAAKASATVGTAPSSTRSIAVWPTPWKTKTPKPPPPISAAMVARPMFCTSTMRMPVRITGKASGNSHRTQALRLGHAHALGGVVGGGRHALEADHGVGDDRQQRIGEQRHHGRRGADAGNADQRGARHVRRHPGERRDQQAEQRDRGDGLDDVEHVQHHRRAAARGGGRGCRSECRPPSPPAASRAPAPHASAPRARRRRRGWRIP